MYVCNVFNVWIVVVIGCLDVICDWPWRRLFPQLEFWNKKGNKLIVLKNRNILLLKFAKINTWI